MNIKVIRIISLLCVLLCVAAICTSSYAAVNSEAIKKFEGTSGGTGSGAVKTIIATVLDVVRLVGASVAVLMLMIIAAKYMIASSGDRADIKKYAMNYVVGAVILFAASSILTIIRDTVKATGE